MATAKRTKAPAPAEPPPRPLRHYRFEVQGWGSLHDRVIDVTATELLGMTIGIDHDRSPVEVFAAEDPELLHGSRRWVLLALVLANPDLSGRWPQWLGLAGRVRRTLPGAVAMRVITPAIFDTEIARLRLGTASGDSWPRVFEPAATSRSAGSAKPARR